MRAAWPGHRWTDCRADRPSSGEGARARTGFVRLAAGGALRDDRRLLPGADAQRRRGAPRHRGW
ncbi:hypothetical protein STAFG_2715 [Streptomyces afghaniensis 772]|uniref:Uncharacterized protein n=1 Tax=Streptomyces afghaniensis 772 TaxID=1283301 RepID=S4MWI6_9ACTN|nr:hypothetical protein STAFG_2715 [Streptomyces afghaniensis 772]